VQRARTGSLFGSSTNHGPGTERAQPRQQTAVPDRQHTGTREQFEPESLPARSAWHRNRDTSRERNGKHPGAQPLAARRAPPMRGQQAFAASHQPGAKRLGNEPHLSHRQHHEQPAKLPNKHSRERAGRTERSDEERHSNGPPRMPRPRSGQGQRTGKTRRQRPARRTGERSEPCGWLAWERKSPEGTPPACPRSGHGRHRVVASKRKRNRTGN
jgi:hypothetical protein